MASELTNQLAEAKDLAKNLRYEDAANVLRAVIDSKDCTYCHRIMDSVISSFDWTLPRPFVHGVWKMNRIRIIW